MDFNKFKKEIIEKYKGKIVIQAVLGYAPEVTFSINGDSYIVNDYTKKVLSSDAAYHIWNFMYKNQSLIGKLFSERELLVKKYKMKSFILNGEEFVLLDIENGENNTYTLVAENNEKTIGRVKSITKEQIEGLQWQL